MPWWVFPAAMAAGNLIGNALSQRASERRTANSNFELAQFQASANQRYLADQLAYNTPKMQMQRFQEAGLNPNLVYGQGSPGNQSTPLTYPEIGRVNYSNVMAGGAALQTFNQTALTQSQTQAMDAKTRQTHVLTEVNKLQARVLERNPLLNDAGFAATIDSLKSAAEIKGIESGMKASELMVQQASAGHQVNKIFQEVQLLEQRFKLAGLDAQIKAQVLTSKEFQNAILEIQKRWMTDADITPQHIYQFIQMLLLKLL